MLLNTGNTDNDELLNFLNHSNCPRVVLRRGYSSRADINSQLPEETGKRRSVSSCITFL